MQEDQERLLSGRQAEEAVSALYRGFFGRDPDHGSRYWIDQIATGESADRLLASFLASPEYQATKTRQERKHEMASDLARRIGQVPSIHPMTVVDVGAQRLETEPHIYAPLLTYMKARVVGFEPLEHRVRERKDAETASDLTLRPMFIGNGGPQTFHLCDPDANSSLLPLNKEIVDDLAGFDDLRTVSTEQVSTVTLDDAVADVKRVDFLKLDIQGFEYQALKHASRTLARTLVVHCEVEFLEMYQHQAPFSEIDLLLTRSGFRFLDFGHLCRYRYKADRITDAPDQLLWGDAIYFRERASLTDPAHLLIQALIASAIYGKSSLAAFLLQEHRDKTNT